MDQIEIERSEVWRRLTTTVDGTPKKLAGDPHKLALMQRLVDRYYDHRRGNWEPEIGEAWHPDDWRGRLREQYPGLDAGMDFERGWADIMSAGASLAADAGQDFGISYGKEKFGMMSLFPTHWPEGDLDGLEDAMERLSTKICEVCGAPGRNRSTRGWWRTTCDRHAEDQQ